MDTPPHITPFGVFIDHWQAFVGKHSVPTGDAAGALRALAVSLPEIMSDIERRALSVLFLQLVVRLLPRTDVLQLRGVSEAAFGDLSAALRMLASMVEAAAGGTRTVDPRVTAVVRFITRESSNSALQLSDVAEHVGLSPCYVVRLLARETGIGFRDLLRSVRLHKGRDLLITTFLSIKEIATLCGYGRPNEFARDFKRRFKCTPSTFRSAGTLSAELRKE